MARPKLNNKVKRTLNVNVALNQKEHQKLSKMAAKSGKRLAVFIRENSLAKHKIITIPKINRQTASLIRDVYSALVRIGLILERTKRINLDAELFTDIRSLLRLIHAEMLNYGDNEDNKR
ncbi:MAG: hypothetical protein ACK5NT_10640 [Pyrinomonadaceae bacterium]